MPDFLNALAQFAPYDTLDSTPFDTGAVQSMGAAQQARPHGFLNTIGQIGDVLAMIGNRTPVYSTVNAQRDAQARQQQVQQALAHVNPNDPNSVNALLPLNPELWAKLRGATQDDAYTLSEGQIRYQGGREIARGPDKGPDVTVIDGVAFDKNTGQPLFESPYDRIIAGPNGSFYRVPRAGYGRNGPAPQQQGQAVTGGPQPGAVVNGYRFRGGNPNDRAAWEPVAGGAGSNAGGTFRP